MILRFIAENIASFKDCVEFNTFPSSKSHSHENHKVVCDHATALRMSAVYGANGAGKSNLFILMAILQKIVLDESLRNAKLIERTFKFDKECAGKPSGLAIEFFSSGIIFYYHIEFDDEKVVLEELFVSKKNRDLVLFTRKDSSIDISESCFAKGYNQQFKEALNRLVRPDMLLLSFMGKYYPDEMPLLTEAYLWFTKKLQLVRPNSYALSVPHLLDSNEQFAQLANTIMPELKTGISKLTVRKEIINEDSVKGNTTLENAIQSAKQNPGIPQEYFNKMGEISNVVYEDKVLYLKTLGTIHNTDGEDVEMDMVCESDGTRRLIDYLPLFYDILKGDKVYVVDEIERSIHPILIKSLMSKLSESTDARGQLIFSTHESALLDQSIFRPDEIWFAQKDSEQATQLYPLSDYNIHKTANIENGYLNGRYGGIPFLANLKDLHW